MKKRGILTFWGVPNYGCFLQAYALQKVIQQICPDDEVVQIAYLNKKHYRFYYSLYFDLNYRMKWINPYFYYGVLRGLKKVKDKRRVEVAYRDYYEMIPHTRLFSEKSLSLLELDSLTLGSDIIWDCNSALMHGDKALFGVGINAKKVFSYAPSFCNSAHADHYDDYVIPALKNMSAITVRDRVSAETVYKLIGDMPRIMIDPIFLWDFNSDGNVVRPGCDSYIVVYGSHFTEHQIKDAKKYADDQRLRLINLEFMGENYEWCHESIKKEKLSPFEWVGYLKYSSAVMTSTYHGMIFGLMFGKPVVFNPTDFIIKKAEEFIEELGLADVMVSYENFYDKLNYHWDYQIINEKLNRMKEKAMDYLRENLR